MDDSIEARYAAVFRDGPLREAVCLSWIRGVEPEEVLRRLGAIGPHVTRTLDEVDKQVGALYERRDGSEQWLEPIGAVAGRLDAWTLLVEPNGWAATVAADLHALSVGTEAVSVSSAPAPAPAPAPASESASPSAPVPAAGTATASAAERMRGHPAEISWDEGGDDLDPKSCRVARDRSRAQLAGRQTGARTRLARLQVLPYTWQKDGFAHLPGASRGST